MEASIASLGGVSVLARSPVIFTSSPARAFRTRSMPQTGQAPCLSERTVGCMGQVYWSTEDELLSGVQLGWKSSKPMKRRKLEIGNWKLGVRGKFGVTRSVVETSRWPQFDIDVEGFMMLFCLVDEVVQFWAKKVHYFIVGGGAFR